MSVIFKGDFLIALRKAPSKRTPQEIETLQKTFATLSSLKSAAHSQLLKYATKARYEYYPANSILYKKGDDYSSQSCKFEKFSLSWAEPDLKNRKLG